MPTRVRRTSKGNAGAGDGKVPANKGQGAVENAVLHTRETGANGNGTQKAALAQTHSSGDRRITAVLVFALAGTPLGILPARFETYDTTPKLLVIYLSAALLLWFSSRWWYGVAALQRNRYGKAFSGVLLLIMVSLVVSASTSGDAWLSFAGTVWRRLGACTQLLTILIAGATAAHVSTHRDAAKTLMLGMEAAAGLASVYAVLQYFGVDPLIPRAFYTLGLSAAVRPPATLTQATYFATFLLPGIFIAAGFRLSETRPLWKRTHELLLLLSLAALFLTGTRAALLGLAVAVCLLVSLLKVRLWNRRILLRAGFAFAACAIAAILFLLTPAAKPTRARLAQWTDDRRGGPRLLVWRDSIPLIWQHPVAGIGPELFEPEFRKAESLDLARAYPDAYHESPHNFFLEVAAAQGVTGLVAWLFLLGVTGASGLRAGRAHDSIAAVLLAAIAAMLVSLQFCPLTVTNELYLLALAGITLGRQSHTEGSKVVTAPVFTRFAMALAVALFIAGTAYAAQASIYTFVERQAARGNFAIAERWFAIVRKLPMPGPNLELSRQIASAARFAPSVRPGGFPLAQQAADAAELCSGERFNALYQSAMLAIATRDLPRAEKKLRSAAHASPTWYRPPMALASVLWWQGRNSEANIEAARALKCAGRLEPNVRRTLDSARAQASVSAALSGRALPKHR